MPPIVHPGAPEVLVLQFKTKRFDKVQMSPSGGTEPSDISRIRGNFRLKEDDMHELKLPERGI
jgi:hypothetical protein